MKLDSKTATGFEKNDSSSESSAMGLMLSNTLKPTGELSKQRMIKFKMSIVRGCSTLF
jgi:hypothetical protein